MANRAKLYEKDTDLRNKLISQACSTINKAIPYPDKVEDVYSNSELLKNLILAHPLQK